MNFPALEKAVRDAQLKELSPEALDRFHSYLNLILKWNSKLNLTAVREPEAILHRHFIECIQCAQALPVSGEGLNLLDYGSGAGLPGIPIAICEPAIRVTLAESQRKKAAFLREVVRTLGLDANVFDSRVEAMAPERQFDVVTLRAVDRMADACRTAFNRVTPGGWMAIFATETFERELKVALLGIAWKRELPVFGLDTGRILLGQRST